MPPTRPVQQGKRQHGATHPGLAQQKSPTPVSVGLGRKGRRGAAPYLTQAHQCSISARLASRCSVGLRRKPERAKRCRRPSANEVSTLACTWACTVGVSEPLARRHWRRVDSMRSKNCIWTPRISQALTHCCQEGKDCTRISGLVVARATVPDGNRWWRSYRFNALQVPRSNRISSTTV